MDFDTRLASDRRINMPTPGNFEYVGLKPSGIRDAHLIDITVFLFTSLILMSSQSIGSLLSYLQLDIRVFLLSWLWPIFTATFVSTTSSTTCHVLYHRISSKFQVLNLVRVSSACSSLVQVFCTICKGNWCMYSRRTLVTLIIYQRIQLTSRGTLENGIRVQLVMLLLGCCLHNGISVCGVSRYGKGAKIYRLGNDFAFSLHPPPLLACSTWGWGELK